MSVEGVAADFFLLLPSSGSAIPPTNLRANLPAEVQQLMGLRRLEEEEERAINKRNLMPNSGRSLKRL